MTIYTLALTQVELELVCNTLAARPWIEVQGLLAKVQQQVNEQDQQRARDERKQLRESIEKEMTE